MTLSQTIAEHVVSASFERLAPNAVQMTKYSLLDAIGVTLGASGIGEGCDAFVRLAQESHAKSEATILGYGLRTSAALAAFANGAMAHALDFEDAHDGAPVHPNAQVIPAALAIAESLQNVHGRELLTAIAVGCDFVCRLGLCLTKSLDEFGWYPPPILGAFGATAAAARLLKLDARQTLDAMSLTLCQVSCSAEIKHNPESVLRSIRDAFAAQTAVVAAQLAQKGVRGFDAPFEGKAGFFNNFARGAYAPEVLLSGLGGRFEGEHVSFKPWPACRGTHAFIDAAIQLMSQHSLSADDIVAGRMLGHPVQKMLYEPLDRKRAPVTAIDAKFSLPYTVATALTRRNVTLDDYRPSALSNPQVLALAKRLSFAIDTTPGASDNATRGRLELTLKNGSQFALHVENPLGHGSRPMSETDLRSKFLQCAGLSQVPQDPDRYRRLCDVVLDLDRAADTRELFTLLK